MLIQLKKFLICLLVILFIGVSGLSVFLFIQNRNVTRERDSLVFQNQALQSKVDAIGDLTTAYTVNSSMFPGKVIEETDLVGVTIPVSTVNENYVLDTSTIIGKQYKVDVQQGTILTNDLVMSDYDETELYERDMTFAYLPMGLRVGDYIDIRIVLPMGQEFVVVSHKRVYALTENTIKVKLSEAEIMLWTSATRDYYEFGNDGVNLYCTKYTEPGINDNVTAYYPVRRDMEAVVLMTPNITDKALCINSNIRDAIDVMIHEVVDDELNQSGGLVSSGNTSEASSINAAKQYYVPSVNGSTDSSFEDNVNGAVDSLDQVGDKIDFDDAIE